MRKIFNSIDIGTDTIKLVTAELYNGKYNILCTTSVKTSGVRQGLIVNLAGITTTSAGNIAINLPKAKTRANEQCPYIQGNTPIFYIEANSTILCCSEQILDAVYTQLIYPIAE